MKRDHSSNRPKLTDAQVEQLRALDGNPNVLDIPEAPAANWANVRRLFKLRKEAISIRIDADVLEWLRGRSDHYQSEVNRILREKMEADANG